MASRQDKTISKHLTTRYVTPNDKRQPEAKNRKRIISFYFVITAPLSYFN